MSFLSTRVIVFTGGIGAAASAWPQAIAYRDVTETHLPAGLAGACMDAAAGDTDGDGDTDLVLAMEFEPNVLLLNGGDGTFTDASDRLPRNVHDSEDVALADFDGDGDLDIVLVSEDDRTDELYLNDGSGRFADASARLPTDDVSNALAVIDLDADSDVDLLTGNVGTNRVLINDGRGRFVDATQTRWPQIGPSRTQDIELADVDGDGDLDVVVGNEGQNLLFVNEAGRLVDVTSRSLPSRDDETREIRAGDVDGDGDADLVVANVRFLMDGAPRNYLLLNDGSGRFTTAGDDRFPADLRSTFTVQLVDLDGDGDADVVAPSTEFAQTESTDAFVFSTDDDGRISVARGSDLDIDDVDGDGDVDARIVDGGNRYLFSNESGRLVPAPGQPAWPGTVMLDGVDLDGDGSPDLDGTGIWLDAIASGDEPSGSPPGTARRRNIQIADIDSDGDVDMLFVTTLITETGAGYRIFTNDGGRFTAADAGTILPASVYGNGFDVEVADFDADGTADLFLCNRASMAGDAARTGGRQQLLLGRRTP